MQGTLGIRQARSRAHRRQFLRAGARHFAAVAGELLALASLTIALGAGFFLLTGLMG